MIVTSGKELAREFERAPKRDMLIFLIPLKNSHVLANAATNINDLLQNQPRVGKVGMVGESTEADYQ